MHRPWTKPGFLKDTQVGLQWKESSSSSLVPVPSHPSDDTQFYPFHDTSPWSGSSNAVTAWFCRWGNYRAVRLSKAFSIITLNFFSSCKMPSLLVRLQCQSSGQLHSEQQHCKSLGKKLMPSSLPNFLVCSFSIAKTSSGCQIPTFLRLHGMTELSKQLWGEQHLCTSLESVHGENSAAQQLPCLGPSGRAAWVLKISVSSPDGTNKERL